MVTAEDLLEALLEATELTSLELSIKVARSERDATDVKGKVLMPISTEAKMKMKSFRCLFNAFSQWLRRGLARGRLPRRSFDRVTTPNFVTGAQV